MKKPDIDMNSEAMKRSIGLNGHHPLSILCDGEALQTPQGSSGSIKVGRRN